MANLIYEGLKASLPVKRNIGSFYLCTGTRELFFGVDLCIEAARFYDGTKPAAPIQGMLYIDIVSDAGDVWTGTTWRSVFTAIVTKTVVTIVSASASDSEVPATKAAKDYVAGITGSKLGGLACKDNVSEAELRETLKSRINSKIDSASAGDNSADVGSTATKPIVEVRLSPAAGNASELDETEGQEGLKVVIPDTDTHAVVKDKSTVDGSATTYHPTKNGASVGAAIDIPKDMIVQSDIVVTNPKGQAEGTYLELVLANAENSKIYIPTDSLIEYVTSDSTIDDMTVINIDEATHKVTATITDGTITKIKLTTGLQTEISKIRAHANKDELGKIGTGDKEEWGTVADKACEHANEAELNKTEIGDKAEWDTAEQNAKGCADELNTAMGKRMIATEGKFTTLQGDEKTEDSVKKALADVKGYADGLDSDVDTRAKVVEETVAVGTF